MLPKRLDGNAWVVTGANGGLGEALSVELAKLGAHVVTVCRDEARGQAAQYAVRRASGSSDTSLVLCDLSSPDSVREAAQRLQRYPAISGLVHCAGIFTKARTVTKDGLETMFATNYLGPFLLTNLLLPHLERGAPARIITVSAPTTSTLDFDDLQLAKEWKPYHQFGASKMGNLLMAFTLARKLDKAQVTSNAVHPGLMKSDLMHDAPAFLRVLLGLMSRKPEVAARKISVLASSSETAAVTGAFYKGTKLSKAADYAYDAAVQDQLWKASAELVGIAP
jgi:NAD(P)-dependent dehydrogenase (short-subunit alcohol dehydrogenase family)